MDTDNPTPSRPDPVEPGTRDRLYQHVAAHGPARRRRRVALRRSLATALVVVVVGSGVGLAQLAGSAAPRPPVGPASSSTASHNLDTTTTTTIPGLGPTGATGTTGTTGTTGSGTTSTTVPGSPTTTTPTTTTMPPTTTLPAVWQDGTVPAGVDLDQLSCGSSTFCVATDGKAEVVVTHDDGQTWTVVPLSFTPDAISCGDGTSCVASICCTAAGSNANGDEFELTSDGGTTWSTAPIPADNYKVESISCWDGSDCLAVTLPIGEIPAMPQVYATSDGGSTWTAAGSLGVGTTVLDCQSATSCWVTGGGSDPSGSGQSYPLQLLHSTDDGKTWTTAPSHVVNDPSSSLLDLSCPTDGTCDAVGVGSGGTTTLGQIWSTSDAGQHWTYTTLGDSLSLVSVSCVNAFDCWSVGTANGTTYPLPPGETKAGIVFATDDGGATWRILETTSTAYTAIRCHGTDTCVLVGGNQAVTLNP